ncbi:MAG: DUF6603 domain-containing protein [Mycobacteriales bacterium]
MAESLVVRYAADLRGFLADLGVDTAPLDRLVVAAQGIAQAIADPPVSRAEWDAVAAQWAQARSDIEDHLADVLLGALAEVPGLAELAADAGKLSTEGIHGSVDLGPVHLQVSSATLVIQVPRLGDGSQPEPLAIGPFQVGEIAASLSSPLGGGLPGGGSIVRLPGDGGYGGTLELPLGPVQVSAAAVLSMLDGQPSFLAILGVTFLPPIELSFGFSLDRVGGIVGVNRRADTDALRAAVRTGVAGDVLFAARPPASPLALVTAADRLFPRHLGTYLVGPTLRLSWLSFGPEGSLISLDLGVVVEIPTGKVVILGVVRVSIPGLPFVLNLRLDLLGIIDPDQQLVSIDASLVDSHVLGIFEVYGDAAMRLCWGSVGYFVASVGGFFPGFNPEPAHLPAMRRVGMALDIPGPVDVRAEGYFAITSNSLQLGGRLEVGIAVGIEAHGFVQVDAIVLFRPFHFDARVAAGFEVSAGGFSFASVTLSGSISGPGPVVIHGSLSIDVFLFSISWDETFTLGSGPADVLPSAPRLLQVVAEEFAKAANVHAQGIGDPDVVLSPRSGSGARAAVPPTGSLQVEQRRTPLGLLVERADGRPLSGAQGVEVSSGGTDVTERFSPGSYITLTDSEALNRPPFDLLPAGRVLSLPDPPQSEFPHTDDERGVRQIVITDTGRTEFAGLAFDLSHLAALTDAAAKPPALSDPTPLVSALQETWTTPAGAQVFSSATAAHQFARYNATVAVAAADAAAAVDLVGVL